MHWRTRFLFGAIRLFVTPFILIELSSRYLDLHLPLFARSGLALLALFVYWTASSRLQEYNNARIARSRGLKPIPIARGYLPLNLDLLYYVIVSPERTYVAAWMHSLFVRYGANTINIKLLGIDLVLTADRAVIREMLVNGGDGNWEKGGEMRELLGGMLGRGIFSVDGADWRVHRAMTRPYLSKERTSDFDIFWTHGQKTISLLDGISRQSTPVLDLQDLIVRFTMDSACQFLLGECLDTLSRSLPTPGSATLGTRGSTTIDGQHDLMGRFVTAFDESQLLIARRVMRGWLWPMWEFFGSPVERHRRTINEFLDPLVEMAKKRRNAHMEIKWESVTLLDELVRSIEDSLVVRDELLSVLLAGRDTTAGLITFAIYLMSTRPDVEEKLRQEIREICGDEKPTYQMIKRMKYMRAVLDETLRIFPPVPINQRKSINACSLPSSSAAQDPEQRAYYVPAGTQIFYSPTVMQRSPEEWGPDAHEFRPERWLDVNEAAKVRSDFRFVPFNAGPRICLGLNLAYNEVSFILALLVPKFKFRLASQFQPEGSLPMNEWKYGEQMGRVKDENVWPFSTLTMHVRGGIWMSVERVNQTNEKEADA